jgi:alkyl hydroperoxide reductase subunit AhpC
VKAGADGLDLKTAFTDITAATDAGKWKLVFFWPKDFTFVCPTEIVAFGKLAGDFADRDTVVYGVSVDSEFVHLNWRLHHDDLRDLPTSANSPMRAVCSSRMRAWRCGPPS